MPEEKGQHQGANVGAVHVGVRHYNHAMVAKLADIEIVVYPGANGRYHIANGFMAQNLVGPGLLYVEDLATQRQDCLCPSVPPHLGGASCRVSLHQVQLTQRRVFLGAVGQLAGQSSAVHGVLADDEVACLACCVSGPLGRLAFFNYASGLLRVVLEVDLQPIGHHALHLGTDLGVAQSGLRLAFELRVHQLHTDNRRQALPGIVAGQVGLVVLQKLLLARVVVDYAGDGAAKTCDVGAAVYSVDAVGERVNGFGKAIVVLHRRLNDSAVLLTLEVNWVLVDGNPVLIQTPNEAGDTAFEIIGDRGIGPEAFVAAPVALEADPEPFVEVSHLLESLA